MNIADYMMKAIDRIYASDRFFSYDSMLKTCETVEGMLRDLGLKEIRTWHFPADGRITHGGWLMPQGWRPRSAILEVLLPDGSRKEVCSYEKTPCSLMLYSTGCDVTGELTIDDDPAKDVSGKIVLANHHYFSAADAKRLFSRGARLILGDELLGPFAGKNGFEFLNDSCQWYNYTLPMHRPEVPQAGFSLSPNQSAWLRQLLQENGTLTLHARVEADMEDATIPMVSALLPGETDEEILMDGHLFEEGANDNASGCAMMLAIARELSAKKLKRGIRLLFTHEVRSIQAYLNTVRDIPKIVAGIDIDMVGNTMDGCANIGDSSPVFPTYAPCLIKYLLAESGETGMPQAICGMDTQFSLPEFGAPMTYLEFCGVPDYHKSSDTPEVISPEVMEKHLKIALRYVEFLANMGAEQVGELTQMVMEYNREAARKLKASTPEEAPHRQTPDFAADAACRRLMSILPMVEAEKRKDARMQLEKAARECEALFDFELPGPSRMKLNPRDAEELSAVVPVKIHRGFTSFEMAGDMAGDYPKAGKYFWRWTAPGWVEYLLAWSDGKRNAAQIWNMLNDSGLPIETETFREMLAFLKNQGCLRID